MGPAANRAVFWNQRTPACAVDVTHRPGDVSGWQMHERSRQRAAPGKVFDELKHPWVSSGFCAKSRATTELAARRLLTVDNRWTLVGRFIVRQKHSGAKRGRRGFRLIAARLVPSVRPEGVPGVDNRRLGPASARGLSASHRADTSGSAPPRRS